MRQPAAQVRPVVRGRSRFRLRIQLVLTGLRPYRWEIYDEEDGRTVRRSGPRFRSSAEAWRAGTAVLDAPDARPAPDRSPGR
jgi:hypothetical protein